MANNSNVRYGLFGSMLSLVPIMIGFTYLYHRRRNLHPMRGRMPSLVLVTSILFIIYYVTLCASQLALANKKPWPCIVLYLITYLCELGLFSIYLVRAYNLIARHQLTLRRLQSISGVQHQLMELHAFQSSATIDDNDAVGEIMLHQDVEPIIGEMKIETTKSTFALKLFVIIVSIGLIPTVILLFIDEELRSGDTKCTFGIRVIITNVVLGCLLVAYIPAGIVIRRFDDGFLLKLEFEWAVFAAIVSLVATLLIGSDTNDVDNISWVFYLRLYCIILAMIASIIWPLRDSYRPQYQPEQPELSTLQHVMDNRSAREQLRNFLKREFCVENLLFLEVIDEYRTKFDARDLFQNLVVARSIASKFIAARSDFEINISNKLCNDIHAKLRRKSAAISTNDLLTCFDRPYSEIWMLIERGPLPRFLTTMNNNNNSDYALKELNKSDD